MVLKIVFLVLMFLHACKSPAPAHLAHIAHAFPDARPALVAHPFFSHLRTVEVLTAIAVSGSGMPDLDATVPLKTSRPDQDAAQDACCPDVNRQYGDAAANRYSSPRPRFVLVDTRSLGATSPADPNDTRHANDVGYAMMVKISTEGFLKHYQRAY